MDADQIPHSKEWKDMSARSSIELPEGILKHGIDGHDGPVYTDVQVRELIEADRRCRGRPVAHRLLHRPSGEPLSPVHWVDGLPPKDALVYFDVQYAYDAGCQVETVATPQQGRPPVAEPACDCERAHNGMGMAGRKCDCTP